MYNNYIYGIFNQNNIQEQMRQQQIQLHHNDQMRKGFNCVHKLEDFLKSMDEVEPEYQKFVFEQCCLVIANHISKNSRV